MWILTSFLCCVCKQISHSASTMLLLLAFLSTAVGTPTTFRDHPCENCEHLLPPSYSTHALHYCTVKEKHYNSSGNFYSILSSLIHVAFGRFWGNFECIPTSSSSRWVILGFSISCSSFVWGFNLGWVGDVFMLLLMWVSGMELQFGSGM